MLTTPSWRDVTRGGIHATAYVNIDAEAIGEYWREFGNCAKAYVHSDAEANGERDLRIDVKISSEYWRRSQLDDLL